jgi:hypothetical protein
MLSRDPYFVRNSDDPEQIADASDFPCPCEVEAAEQAMLARVAAHNAEFEAKLAAGGVDLNDPNVIPW